MGKLSEKEKANIRVNTAKEIITNWYLALNPAPKGLPDMNEPKKRKRKSKKTDYMENIRKSNFPIEEFEELLLGNNIAKYSISELLNINRIFYGKTEVFVSDKERGIISY